MSAHTPTPWHAGGIFLPGTEDAHCSIWSATPPGYQSGDQVAQLVALPDAKFIICACNTHDDLLAALRNASRFIEEGATTSGYGFYRPANPHDFSPDHESCSADEIAAHKAACDAFDKGEYTPPLGSETIRDDKGEMLLHILRAPWGIGSYSETDPDAEPIIAAARAAIAKAEGK